MGRKDDSVFNEPQFQEGPHKRDPSEEKAETVLRKEANRGKDSTDELQSVNQEPAIFPGLKQGFYDRDWSCSRCGYNLRGRPFNEPCPSCGHRERYLPTSPVVGGYARWLNEHLKRSTASKGLLAVLACAAAGGPFAVVGAFIEQSWLGPTPLFGFGLIMAGVIAPLVEETLKISTAAFVVERRPYLFTSAGQIMLAAIGAAAIFSVIENLLYLNVYIRNPSEGLRLWRWTACVALHLGCTTLAASGLVRVWRRTIRELRPPAFSLAVRRITAAAVLHGLYNTGAIIWENFFG